MTDGWVVAGPSPIHGTGTFAARPIPAGTQVGTYEGLATAVDGTYVLWVETDDGSYRGIDGENELRWLNHSRTANVEFDGPDLWALSDIAEGTELLFDYGEEWSEVP